MHLIVVFRHQPDRRLKSLILVLSSHPCSSTPIERNLYLPVLATSSCLSEKGVDMYVKIWLQQISTFIICELQHPQYGISMICDRRLLQFVIFTHTGLLQLYIFALLNSVHFSNLCIICWSALLLCTFGSLLFHSSRSMRHWYPNHLKLANS